MPFQPDDPQYESAAWLAEARRRAADREAYLLEQYGQPEASWVGQQARGFAAGVLNPFGLTGWGARGLAAVAPGVLSREAATRFQDRMHEWDADAPYASAAGSVLLPGAGWLRLGLRMTGRETMGALPHLLGLTGSSRMVYEVLTGGDDAREERRRARDYGNAGY